MFCDICDMFDQHDTDDCPKQGETSDDGGIPNSHYNGDPKAVRPYCEICEGRTIYIYICVCFLRKMVSILYVFVVVSEFDHHTEDCDDEQTF